VSTRGIRKDTARERERERPTMSASKETSASWTLTAMVFTTAVVITAAATHHLTKRNEQQQQNALVWKQYQREKLLHEKTAAARKAAREPSSGSLIEDVIVDKIYLWECQDLCKHFPSADVENTMKNLFLVKRSPIQSPMLRIMTSLHQADYQSRVCLGIHCAQAKHVHSYGRLRSGWTATLHSL
jgi:hypothetical protein